MMAPLLPGGMPLSALLADVVQVPPKLERAVLDITLDSRDVGPGSCFLALAGTSDDGARYIGEAAMRGAVAIVTEQPAVSPRADLPLFHTPVLRAQLGLIAERFFAAPAREMQVFGVTGTNGKTSVAFLLAQALTALGRGCGYIGTLGAGEPGALTPIANTTPDVIALNRWLARFAARRLPCAALEVSSHALAQKRLAGVTLHAAAFTNLGHDHLDYHVDREAYGAAKRSLFRQPGLRAAVVNVDDALGAEIARTLPVGIAGWTTSAAGRDTATASARHVRATDVDVAADGLRFTLHGPGGAAAVAAPLPGRFNVDNLLTVAALLLAAGHPLERVAASFAGLRPAPGRLQGCGRTATGAHVYVDYAHSPDSLAAVLSALGELAPRRLHLVFGCGGERDRSKRPLMGAIAARAADHVIVTADNPRGEDPDAIAAEILAGMPDAAGGARAGEVVHVPDRAEAIAHALAAAGEGDIVLVAGKGHETTQERCGRRLPFSDVEVIRALIAEQGP
jgi:UDP-N-acetylmuramoyl-L-alanyl-D-glutamate--2,6-diaminopimelate ligase